MTKQRPDGIELFQHAHKRYEKHLENGLRYKLKDGFCIPVTHSEDQCFGYVDPINRSIIWCDGILDTEVAWYDICEFIAHYLIRHDWLFREKLQEQEVIK